MRRVRKVWDTGMSVNPVVGFRLKVRADGIELFEVPGTELAVMFDPEDHTRVALDLCDERK